MAESDIRLFMRRPWVVTSSDGSDGHPRQHATFPMKHVKYTRDDKVISLGELIHSSSGRTADLFKLDHRGYLKDGYFADTRAVFHAGNTTGEAPGRVLLRTPPPGTCP